MKVKELKEKNISELTRLLSEKRHEMRKLRFDTATKQMKNSRGARNIRRDIARILTIIREEKQ